MLLLPLNYLYKLSRTSRALGALFGLMIKDLMRLIGGKQEKRMKRTCTWKLHREKEETFKNAKVISDEAHCQV